MLRRLDEGHDGTVQEYMRERYGVTYNARGAWTTSPRRAGGESLGNPASRLAISERVSSRIKVHEGSMTLPERFSRYLPYSLPPLH